jgi:hypothetical protein
MFDKLNALRAERDELSVRITRVNHEIVQEFGRIDAEIVAKRKEMGAFAAAGTKKVDGRRGRKNTVTPEALAAFQRNAAHARAVRSQRLADKRAAQTVQ